MIQRNYSIDILKFLCAVLVVFLHTDCAYRDVILPFTRCAVPCFFIISGYLLYNDNGIGETRLKHSIAKTLRIILYATVLFAILKECKTLFSGHLYIPTKRSLLAFVIFNENPFAYHLWYLGAYLYVLIIVYFVERYNKWKLLFFLIPVLLLCDLVFGKYSLLLFGREFPYTYVRNFLFVGIPYFSLGVWLKRNLSVMQVLNKQKLIWGVIVFGLTSIAERFMLSYLNINPARDHYISTTFLALALFMYVLSFRQREPNVLSRLGEKDSLYIYIFHPLFLTYVFPVINRVMPSVWLCIYNWVAPFVVLLATIVFIEILRALSIIK